MSSIKYKYWTQCERLTFFFWLNLLLLFLQLVAISQFHVRQLLQQSHAPMETISVSMDTTMTTTETIGNTYLPRLQMLVDAYSAFSQGQDSAFTLLEQLCTHNQRFIGFMKKLPGCPCNGELNLAQFLDFPLQHLDTLSVHLQQVLECTKSSHLDFAPLCDVVEALSYTCHSLNESL